MSSCQHSTMLAPRTSSIFHAIRPFRVQNLRHSTRFRGLLGPIPPRFAVFSSMMGPVFASVNVVAAAAAVASGSSAHGAVTSAITQVAVTAVAIASGACLSTKVDFLWPKVEEQPGALTLDGVDVTGCPIFYDEKAGAKGYCICTESTPWPVKENWRTLLNTLYPYRTNTSGVSPIKRETSAHFSLISYCCQTLAYAISGGPT